MCSYLWDCWGSGIVGGVEQPPYHPTTLLPPNPIPFVGSRPLAPNRWLPTVGSQLRAHAILLTMLREPTHLATDERGGKPWLEITLLSAFIVSLLIGLVALAAFLLYYDTSGSDLTDDPLTAFDAAQVSPGLALNALSGDSANALAYQALNAGELATAHALVLFDTQAIGSQRSGLMMQLARAYANDAEQAAQVYKLAQALAILDPTIPPIERNQNLVQVADGFFIAGQEEAASESAYQALTMAAQLPDLVPAQRADLFASLIPVAEELGDDQLLQTVEDLARNPFLTPTGILPPPQLRQLADPLTPDEALLHAQTTRQMAARQLSDRLQYTGGEDIEPERLALEIALRTEDQVRNDYFGRMLNGGISLNQQVTLLADHRAWIALKAQVALQGFGLSIVPDWENNSNYILQDLGTVTSNMDVNLDALAKMQPVPTEQVVLQVEALQWLALQSDLGLYPDAPVSSLSQRLEIAQNSLAGLGQPLALPVAHAPDAVPPGFRIQRSQP